MIPSADTVIALPLKELIEQYGFTFVGNCHCDGQQTDKYDKGDYQLRVRVKKNTIKLKKSGRSVTQWIPVTQFPSIINSFPDVAIKA
jgi:hypothetical protein